MATDTGTKGQVLLDSKPILPLTFWRFSRDENEYGLKSGEGDLAFNWDQRPVYEMLRSARVTLQLTREDGKAFVVPCLIRSAELDNPLLKKEHWEPDTGTAEFVTVGEWTKPEPTANVPPVSQAAR